MQKIHLFQPTFDRDDSESIRLGCLVLMVEAPAGEVVVAKVVVVSVLGGAGFDALGSFLPKANIDPPDGAVVVAGAPPNKLLG